MLKMLLVNLGLHAAPTPVRTYVAVSSLVGAVPALAYVAWKNREKLASLWQQFSVRAPSRRTA